MPNHCQALASSTLIDCLPCCDPLLDFYGNSMLYYCSAKTGYPVKSEKIRKLIFYNCMDQALFYYRNNGGQTFLHVLCNTGFSSKEEFADFINLLGIFL
jgi:hypothetical protein